MFVCVLILLSSGLAFTAIIIDLFLAIFYNTVIAWAVYYMFMSFTTELPWKYCDKEWNTQCCFPLNEQRNMPASLNFSLAAYDSYQRRLGDNYIYKVYDKQWYKRVVMFNLKSAASSSSLDVASASWNAIGNFFKHTNTTLVTSGQAPIAGFYDHLNASYDTHLGKIESWLKSYFLIVDQHVEPLPRISVPDEKMAAFAHDPKLLTDFVERHVMPSLDVYKNKSLSLVLNCAAHLNNPTQEFYTRYLTEMHRSTGLEDLGQLKFSLILCLLLVFITVYFALWKGIKSAGKVSQ